MKEEERPVLPSIIDQSGEEAGEFVSVGTITKVEGGRELLVKMGSDTDYTLVGEQYMLTEIDGGIVPLEIKSVVQRGSRQFVVSLRHHSEEHLLQAFVGCKVMMAVDEDEEDGEEGELSGLIGFTLVDVSKGEIGEIVDVDDRVAANPLLVVEREDGEELLVPAADEFVVSIDEEGQTITMEIPEGLLDIDAVEEV
jgi:16S rRNA processing protein RimM